MFIDELTWEETRDAMKAGKTTVIIPTGGTEKNGYHMMLGKHNVIVTHSANLMARRLKNALVAPTIQYVPEGNPDRAGPGIISLPSPAYDQLLDAAARSLKAHGFKDIIFIGDSGGNQAGMRAVADALNKEWAGSEYKVFALTDYYEGGRDHYRAWLEAAFGYDDQTIGSHAGISDTSQLLHVRPAGGAQRSDQALGRPAGFGRLGRSDEGDGGNRPHGDRVQGQRGAAQYRQLKTAGRGTGKLGFSGSGVPFSGFSWFGVPGSPRPFAFVGRQSTVPSSIWRGDVHVLANRPAGRPARARSGQECGYDPARIRAGSETAVKQAQHAASAFFSLSAANGAGGATRSRFTQDEADVQPQSEPPSQPLS